VIGRNPNYGDDPGRCIKRAHGTLEYRFSPGKLMEIVNIEVAGGHRNKGIGSSMVMEAFEIARKEGCVGVYGFCRPENTAARRFYVRLGFSFSPALLDFYGSREDAVVFHKLIARQQSPNS